MYVNNHVMHVTVLLNLSLGLGARMASIRGSICLITALY